MGCVVRDGGGGGRSFSKAMLISAESIEILYPDQN